jgi:hypothetical protein
VSSLINYGVRRLPPSARWVAWIDADVQFLDADWVGRTIASLRQFAVVQMFAECRFLGVDGETESTFHSFGYSAVHRMPLPPRYAKVWYPHPGFAWAMRRDVFVSIGGLADFHIVGNGDRHFAYALSGLNDDLNKMHFDYLDCTLNWRRRTQRLLAVAAERLSLNRTSLIGYVDMPIAHMWHGSRAARKYATRDRILSANQYNPKTDLAPMPEGEDTPLTHGKEGTASSSHSSSSSSSSSPSVVSCPSPVSSMGVEIRALRSTLTNGDVSTAEEVMTVMGLNDTSSRQLGLTRHARLTRMQQAFVAYFQGRREDSADNNAANNATGSNNFG